MARKAPLPTYGGRVVGCGSTTPTGGVLGVGLLVGAIAGALLALLLGGL